MTSAPFKPTVQEIRMGAIYRLGRCRSFDAVTIVSLLTARAGFSSKDARLLAAHWVQSYRAHRRAERVAS